MSDLESPATPARLRALQVAGVLDAASYEQAMAAIDRRPDAASWQRWAGVYLATLGACLVGSGVIFFFAANWQAMGRWARFGLAGLVFVAAAGAAWRMGTQAMGGRALALLAGILVGPLFAVYGQEWQTGADPWELFAAWALLAAGFAYASGLELSWALVMLLGHVAVILRAMLGDSNVLVSGPGSWVRAGLVLLDVIALAGAVALDRKLLARLASLTAFGLVLVPSVMAAGGERDGSGIDLLIAIALVAGAFVSFREKWPDLFQLALSGAMAATLVGAVGFRVLFASGWGLGSLFLYGLFVLGEAAGLAVWLRAEHRRINAQGEELR